MEGSRSYAKRVSLEERRAKVADLTLRGYSNREVARMLGLPERSGHVLVAQDMKVVRGRWRQSSIADFDAIKAKQLAKLELLEKELWASWHRSKEKGVEVTRTTKPAADGEGATPAAVASRKVVVTGRDGSPALANAILSCIHDQNELHGLLNKDAAPGTSPPILGFRIHVVGGATAPAEAVGDDGAPALPPPPSERAG